MEATDTIKRQALNGAPEWKRVFSWKEMFIFTLCMRNVWKFVIRKGGGTVLVDGCCNNCGNIYVYEWAEHAKSCGKGGEREVGVNKQGISEWMLLATLGELINECFVWVVNILFRHNNTWWVKQLFVRWCFEKRVTSTKKEHGSAQTG